MLTRVFTTVFQIHQQSLEMHRCLQVRELFQMVRQARLFEADHGFHGSFEREPSTIGIPSIPHNFSSFLTRKLLLWNRNHEVWITPVMGLSLRWANRSEALHHLSTHHFQSWTWKHREGRRDDQQLRYTTTVFIVGLDCCVELWPINPQKCRETTLCTGEIAAGPWTRCRACCHRHQQSVPHSCWRKTFALAKLLVSPGSIYFLFVWCVDFQTFGTSTMHSMHSNEIHGNIWKQ